MNLQGFLTTYAAPKPPRIQARPQPAPTRTLADFLREDAGMTGTKLGCDLGVCGACTVLIDDEPSRGCLVFAVQAAGRRIRTVEGLAEGRELNQLQQSFRENFALQCGFCTGGILMSMTALREKHPDPSREQVVEWLSGHICRCTGYETIVKAVLEADTLGEA